MIAALEVLHFGVSLGSYWLYMTQVGETAYPRLCAWPLAFPGSTLFGPRLASLYDSPLLAWLPLAARLFVAAFVRGVTPFALDSMLNAVVLYTPCAGATATRRSWRLR